MRIFTICALWCLATLGVYNTVVCILAYIRKRSLSLANVLSLTFGFASLLIAVALLGTFFIVNFQYVVRAQHDKSNLRVFENAFSNYLSKYQSLVGRTGESDLTIDLSSDKYWAALTGASRTYNPDGLVFLDVGKQHRITPILDALGGHYFATLDANTNNVFELKLEVPTRGRSVLVWSESQLLIWNE